MKGYKILYVEDNPDKETVELLFSKHIKTELLNDEIDDWFAFFEKVPAIDYAARLTDNGSKEKGALTLLKENADDYLLFIVDRDLLNDKKLIPLELDKIETAWEGFNRQSYDHKYRLDSLISMGYAHGTCHTLS